MALNPVTKAIRKAVRIGLPSLGLEVYGNTITWPKRQGFHTAHEAIKHEGITGIPLDRCFTLYSAAQSIRDVPGDIFECGCRFGKSSRFIMSALGEDSEKNLHVFDSFEGLSKPEKEDAVASFGGKASWSAGDLAAEENLFRKNMKTYENRLKIYRGWIPDRFKDVPDDVRFSLAHIDVDLYKPSLDSLEFVYDRVAPQGVIVCDDYGSVRCPGAKQAFDEFFATRPENLIELPTMQALVIKI